MNCPVCQQIIRLQRDNGARDNGAGNIPFPCPAPRWRGRKWHSDLVIQCDNKSLLTQMPHFYKTWMANGICAVYLTIGSYRIKQEPTVTHLHIWNHHARHWEYCNQWEKLSNEEAITKVNNILNIV
jgi:hypothetical protein